jgi:hypothetical protein
MSHFVIWRDRILLFTQYEGDIESAQPLDESTVLTDAVRGQLAARQLISFTEIADALGAVPWDVLTVCRRLVRMGFAYEGQGEQRGRFGRA